MELDTWSFAGIFVIGLSMVLGFFITKKPGFGRYATSSLVIIAVLAFSCLLFASGKLDEKIISNIFFSALGFAAGLFTSRESTGE